jgi:hypothetical protein
MKICIYSESTADEAALRILADALLGIASEPVLLSGAPLRARGFSTVFGLLPSIVRQLHFHSEAEGLLVAVDSDDGPVHTPRHNAHSSEAQGCRFCRLARRVQQSLSGLSHSPTKKLLKVAMGVPVPAIEAWLLFGKKHPVGEAHWQGNLPPKRGSELRQELKDMLYKDRRAPDSIRVQRAKEEATRLTGDLNSLEAAFPEGFGCLAKELRKWRAEREGVAPAVIDGE